MLSLPGTTRFRLRPHESGYENLVLAGDWTRNAINGGCVESAVMSGLDAARHLDPAVRPGIGDWLAGLETQRGTSSRRRDPVSVLALAAQQTASAASPRALPRYALRDGELIAVPPILLDIDVTMFVLRARLGRLEQVLDQLLNLDPGGATYRPLAPLAILYFARVDNHAVTDPLGYVPEYDFGIWVPALGGHLRRGRFEPDRLVTFSPYLWVSNDVALTNGRSIFGFFKDLGTTMSMPDSERPDRPFALDAWVMSELGPGKPLSERRLLEVRRSPATAHREPWIGLGRLAATLARSIGDRGQRETQLAGLRSAMAMAKAAPLGQRMVLLKQFPDAIDARRACYQAVLEADIRFQGRPVTAWRTCDDRVVINEYDSHRIVSTLGLETEEQQGERHTLRPIAAARSQFRAALGPAELIWERGGAAGARPS
ncbi:MAG: FAD-dependent oxidoreductase [Myxococcales bacterium]|nr:FAD-dependent oxidoreductase [Myxococcales bacterium]